MVLQYRSSHGFRNFNSLCNFGSRTVGADRCSFGAALYGSNRRLLSTKTPENYYDVLEITPKAGKSQIKAAYYRLSKKYHPDVNESEDAHDQFSNITEAYEVLGNQRLKRLYDRGQQSGKHVRVKGHDNDYEAVRRYRDIQSRSIVRKVQKTRKGNEVFAGQTKIYDFDEYYRMHYGNQVKNQKDKAAKQERVQEEYDKIVRKKRIESTHLTFFILVALAFIIGNNVERGNSKTE